MISQKQLDYIKSVFIHKTLERDVEATVNFLCENIINENRSILSEYLTSKKTDKLIVNRIDANNKLWSGMIKKINKDTGSTYAE